MYEIIKPPFTQNIQEVNNGLMVKGINIFNTGRHVDLEQHKEPAFSAPLCSVPIRECVYVPLYDPLGGNMYPIPRKGDRCARFSPLARTKTPSNEFGPSWIMSPVSGYVEDIVAMEHGILGRIFCAVIRPDNSVPPLPTVQHSLSTMTIDGVLRTIHQAGIIDEFDGEALISKILRARENKIREIAAIALDDSPYISSALKTVCEFAADVTDGITVVLKAIDGGSAKLAVFDCDEVHARPDSDRFGFVKPVRMSGGFPLISKFKRQYYPNGDFLPIGVQALRAAANALIRGIPQTNGIVTVSGDCIKHPCNAMIVNGTPLEDVLRFVGVNKVPNFVIFGDTMNGVAVTDMQIPVPAGTRAITVMHSLSYQEKTACTRCGKCVTVCPMGLPVYLAMRYYENGDVGQAASFGAEQCSGCGACSAVCPSGIETADIMRGLKKYKRSLNNNTGKI